MSKNKFYAYFIENENQKGITQTWNDCSKAIAGKKSRYKGFKTQAEAQEWLLNGAEYTYKSNDKVNLKQGVYFDAGTGRGIGVEVKITDHHGNNLLSKMNSQEGINEFGNYLLKNVTNNYGELFGMYLALHYSLKYGIKNIFGDSRLVIDYWSKGHMKRHELPEDTCKLADKVTVLRKKFESSGGIIEHVSGDINPADLGFHR